MNHTKPPRSLARAARRAHARMGGHRGHWRLRANDVVHSPWPWLIVPIVFLFAPVPRTWTLPFLSDARAAEDFLQTAWQVQAAAVGFSLTVGVFALQAAGSDGWGTTPRQLARRIWADVVLALGVTSIMVTGVALAGGGRGGPDGWAGTVAVVVGAASLSSVMAVWLASVHAIAGGSLRAVRVRDLRLAVETSVDSTIRERIALSILVEQLKRIDCEYLPMDFGRADRHAVTANASGQVTDIKLRRLIRTLRGQQGRQSVRAHLGTYSSPETVLARVTESRLDNRVRRCFTLSKPSPDGVAEGFAVLHRLAMRAIETNDGLAYDQAAGAYRDVLTIYPKAWSKVGRRFDGDAAGGMTLVSLPTLSDVRVQLARQIVAAAMSPGEALLSASVGTPLLTALDSCRLESEALYLAMLDALVSADQELSRRSPANDLGRGARRALMDTIKYGPVERLTSHVLDLPKRLQAGELAVAAYGRLASTCRSLVDRGDAAGLQSLLEQWAKFTQFFRPDPEDVRWRREFVEPNSTEDLALLQQLDEAEKLLVADERLSVVRTGVLLQVFAWTVYRLVEKRQDVDPTARVVASYLPIDLQQLITAGQMDRFDSSLSNWIIFDRPEFSGGGAIDTWTPVVGAIAVLMIRSTTPGVAPYIQPVQQVADLESGLIEQINRMVTAWPWGDELPARNERERADTAIAAVQAAADQFRRRRDDEIIESSLDVEEVSSFADLVRKGFASTRALPVLLGSNVETGEHRQDDPPTVLTASIEMPKEWLLADRSIGLSDVAQDLGRALAIKEVQHLERTLSTVESIDYIGSVVETIQHGIRLLKDRGSNPSIILVPREWQVRSALVPAMQPLPSTDHAPRSPQAIGTIDGVPVYESQLLPSSKILVADTRQAISWQSTDVGSPGEPIPVEFRVLDRHEAESIAAKDEDWLRESADDDRETRVCRALRLVVVQPKLAAYVALSEPLAVVQLTVCPAPGGVTGQS